MKSPVRAACCLVFLGTPTACAQRSATPTVSVATNDSTTVHAFVQRFYDVYTDARSRQQDAMQQVLIRDSTFLDRSLLLALRADMAANRDRNQPRETINFDPFLESQDPCPKYVVSEVHAAGRSYRVTVRPVCPTADGQRWQTSRPVVEVVSLGSRWMIANVLYTKATPPTDLMALLCRYAQSDVRVALRPTRCQ
jgi:hypothetical protein